MADRAPLIAKFIVTATTADWPRLVNVIAVFFGEASFGEPRAGSDAGSACFVPLDDLGELPMTESALRIIRMARASLLREL